jgi:signal transduction histidine kinase
MDDVLVIGKADAGKLEFAPKASALESFCRELVEEVQLSASKHNINFHWQPQCCSMVYLDEKLLRHILINLLSNAIKYSPQSDRVEFEVLCQSTEVIFHVKDYGIGIPEADREHLFDSFHRATNVGNISGTGLGLAIVKKAVDIHEGTIVVNSQVGTGTTVTVTLPCTAQLVGRQI